MLRGYEVIEVTSDGKNCYLCVSEASSLKFKTKFAGYFSGINFINVTGFMVDNSFSMCQDTLRMICPDIDINLLNRGVQQLLEMSTLTAEVYGWEWNDYDPSSDIIYLDRML